MLVILNITVLLHPKSNEAVFVINDDNKIEYWDDNAERLYEITKEEALGVKANNAVSILSETFS